MAVAKAGPVVSDNGNFIIDAPFDAEYMKHPLEVSVHLPTASLSLEGCITKPPITIALDEDKDANWGC